MDIRIAELQQRLRKNRSLQQQQLQQQQQQQQQQSSMGFSNQRGGSLNAKIGGRPASANIAAVEPYIKHGSNKDSIDQQQGYTISKHDPKYQTLPPNIKLLGPDGKRLDGEPNGNTGMGQSEYGRTDNGHLEKNNNNSGQGDLKVDVNQVGPEISGPQSPGKSAKDLLPKETIHKVPDYKPSKGHTTAFEAMEETLKKSEIIEGRTGPPTRPVHAPSSGYKPSNLSNFTARPFGSTYSTAMFANRSNLITTQPSQSSSPVTTNSISSPGAFFPKTSTPIQGGGPSNNQNDMKEIFITGAPNTSSSSLGKQPLYTTAQSGPTSSSYPPLTIATSHTTPTAQPPEISPRTRTQDANKQGPPHYQIASSRPQEPMQPQLASDAPSPTSPTGQYQQRPSPSLPVPSPSRSHTTPGINSSNNKPNQPSMGNSGAPSTSNHIGRPPAPGQISLSTSTKVNLSEHHASNSSKDSSASSSNSSPPSNHPLFPGGNMSSGQSHIYSNVPHGGQQQQQQQPNQPPKPTSPTDKDAKKDITTTSVSSALSVLMSGPTSTTTTTRPFRYAPKSVIANTYMRKLGSNTLEEYRRTMNQIYKDFQPPTLGEGGNGGGPTGVSGQDTSHKNSSLYNNPDYHMGEPDLAEPPRPAHLASSQGETQPHQQLPPPRKLPDTHPGEQQPQQDISDANAMYPSGPPPYRGAPAYDMDAERIRYKPNAPKTLRRRLSSGESDDLARFNKQQKTPAEGEDSSTNSQLSSGANAQNVVRVDTLQDSYNNNFSGENPPQAPLAISYDIPHGDGEVSPTSQGPSTQVNKVQESKPAVIRRKKTNLKTKGSVRSSRRVSFDPLALLLDASLEGELDLVKRTASEVS